MTPVSTPNRFVARVLRPLKRSLRQLAGDRTDPYHIIPLHDYKAIYFAIPKVANSSLKSLCFDLLGLEAQYPEDVKWKPKVFNQGKVPLLSQQEVRDRYSDYWKFCFVRNPWDRLVSSYHDAIRPPDTKHPVYRDGVKKGYTKLEGFSSGMSFAEFLEQVVKIPDTRAERHFMSQHCYVFDRRGRKLVDFVGRFEHLDADLRSICERLNIHEVELPHLLKSKERESSYRDYYDERLKALAARRYAQDIEVFGYEF